MKKPANPRRLAVDIVAAAASGRAWADERLDRLRERAALSRRDLGLVREIVMGTLRRQLTLDCIIAAFSDRPLGRIQSRTLHVLRTAVYQIVFLDRVPASAAVDEAVKLAGVRAGSFVNAVLRRCAAELERGGCGDPMRSIEVCGRPLSFRRPVFPDPGDERYLAAACSHPQYLVRLLVDAYGEEKARAIMQAGCLAPPVFVRVNGLAATVEDVEADLKEGGIECSRTDLPQMLRLESSRDLFARRSFTEGWISVQDLSAARVAPLLEPTAGQDILDVCAAPGGKSSHLAELTGDGARITACDVSRERLAQLEQNVRRLKLGSVAACRVDMQEPPAEFGGRFDRVLLDAPCSNSGVLGRRPEARYRINADALSALAALQERLLAAAAFCVARDGAIVYSTCSILPQENEAVVERFLARHPKFRVAARISSLPAPGGGDGMYAARIEAARS